MRIELLVAIVAGLFGLVATLISVVNTTAIDAMKRAEDRRQKLSGFSEPLAKAAFDLQSRLYNIINKNLIGVYLENGSEREKSYVANNTVFLVGQYFCWAELVRQQVQLADLDANKSIANLNAKLNRVSRLWADDKFHPPLRVFAGEQMALGEAFIQQTANGPACIGYGSFLKMFKAGTNPLIDALDADVLTLRVSFDKARPRLIGIQHALIELLEALDPENKRFPPKERDKA